MSFQKTGEAGMQENCIVPELIYMISLVPI